MTRRYGTLLPAAVLLVLVAQGSTQGSWTSKAPMLSARYTHAAATLNGLIHVAGGADGSTCSALTTHDVFDPGANSWLPSAPMTTPRSLPAAAVLNDGTKELLYVVGGSTTCSVRTATMEAYDPATNTWTPKAPMPGGPRSGMGAAVIDGLLYVVGGIQFDSAAGVTALAEVYDPVNNSWSTIAAMPNARYAMAVGAIDGILYVAGGGSGTVSNFTAVDAYDPATNTWTSRAPLPVQRAYASSTVANGLLYAIGGQNTANLSSVDIYDPVANAWNAGPALPFTRSIMPAANVAGSIYVAGGGYDDLGRIVADTFMLGDTIAPVTTATPSTPPNANGWYSGDVTVTLKASDGEGGSGVQQIAYFLPGTSNIIPGDGVEVTITAEGITTLTYQATDGAGNLETQRSLTIRIDKTAPFLPVLPNLTASATSSAGAVVNFWISPWDNGSGIASTQVSPLQSGMTFPIGTTRETVTVLDAAGNSTVGGFDVTVNPARPFINVTGGNFTADGNPHPATATAVDQSNNPVAGTFDIAYLPGGSVPVAPGRYSATASFTSNDPAFTSAFPWTTMAPDPNGKVSPGVVEINGKLYVHGFDSDAAGNPGAPRLSIFDPWSNTWTLGASPSLVRAYVSVGAINGRMYVAGGCIAADCRIGTTNAVEIYDPASDTWSNGLAMPTARFGAASGVIGGRLYVAGGTTACPGCVPTTANEIYDPATNAWTIGAPIPVSRELASGAATNGRLYVIGGFQRDAGNPLNGAAVGTVTAYDPVANAWSTHSPMPTARFGAAAGVVFGSVFVAGGYSTVPTAVHERYDPGADGWTPQLPMGTARHYLSGGVVNSTFHVIDGSNGGALSANEAFDSTLTTTITINPADTTPPTTTAIFPQPNANGYHRFNVSVFLNALDSGGQAPPSGVQSITYSLSGAQTGGGTFTSCCTSFNIVNEGTTTVTYHATDARGNVESDQTFTVRLDKTAPSAATLSNITVNATSAAGAVVTFDLAPSDAFSGIDTIVFNQGLPSGSTFPHGSTFEGVVITDKAGNSTFRNFNVTVNKTLVSIAVQPASATISLGQGGRQFTAMGQFTDGSTQSLPSSSGGGGSGSGGFVWQLNFSPSLNVSACGSAPGGLSSQAISHVAGAIDNNWGSGNIVRVTGTLTLQQVNLVLACNPANGSTGSLTATWTGTRYEGTVTSFDGSTSSVVITGWSAKASLPTARFSFGAATVNGIVYAMGGGSPSQPQPVDAYDPSTNSWATVATMQTSREGAGVAALNGRIYVAGGNVSGGNPSGVFEAYDPALNSWSTLAPMPTSRAHLALVAAGGQLYAIGGDTGPGGTPATAVVERYDPAANQWTSRASMAAARTFVVAGALNSDSTIVAVGPASGTTELYDVAANSWTAGPAMLSPGGGPAAAVFSNALFVFGTGSNGIGVQMFRPASGLQPAGWAVLGSMLTGRGQLGAALAGDVVYAVGGRTNAGAILNTVEAFSAPPPSNFSVTSGGGGGSSLPTVSWQSSNTGVASISSSGFATGSSLGQTTIIASAGGITCQPSSCGTLTVADTTPPNLFVPAQPFFVTAVTAAGALVNFSNAVSAFDLVDGSITPTCAPASGSLFAIGSTSVSCQAIDAALNASQVKTFIVQVNDRLTVNVPSSIVVDATSPAGAAVPFSVTATYFLGGTEPVECFIINGFVDGNPQIGPAVSPGATFPVGTTTVGCQATSASGQHTGDFFSITVLSASQMITNLTAQASEADFKQGGNLLQNALQSIVSGNVSEACSQLGAFINQVQAQSGKSLSPDAAAALVQSAMKARAALGC